MVLKKILIKSLGRYANKHLVLQAKAFADGNLKLRGQVTALEAEIRKLKKQMPS
jgi:hypothetical protein